MIIDSHCHLADPEFYADTRQQVYERARAANVVMILASESVNSSVAAVEYAARHEGCYPLVGIHPHHAAHQDVSEIARLLTVKNRIVGIGEIGLDYYYDNSPRHVQQAILRQQLTLAVQYHLPVSFHVRDAFADFWPILDEFTGVRGVLHSFTDTQQNADEAIKRGLYIGINGISTFTKVQQQLDMYKVLDLSHILLETDAPFLTPSTYRGKINEPAYVGRVAEHQGVLKGLPTDEIIRVTTLNAQALFNV